MIIKKIVNSYRNLSLQNIITLPFLLQIFLTVGLVGYLSWRNGEQAVNNVTSKLRSEVTAGVKQHLENYLATPHLIVQLKQKSIKLKQLDLNDLPSMQPDFWSTIRLFDSVRAIYLGDETGKFIYIKQEAGKFYSREVKEVPKRRTYILDNLGQKRQLLEVDEYDPRQRPWYVNSQITQRNNWSKIYTFSKGELGITAAGLVKDSQSNIQGIVGVDLILSGINNFLQNIEISKNGQVFILERNGYLVATSTTEKPFIYDRLQKKEKRLRVIDSQNLLTKATAQHISNHFGSLYQLDRPEQLDFKLTGDGIESAEQNNRQFVQVLPYQDKFGLDWLIVVVIPEADFMQEIHANTRNTIWLCLLALAIACILGIYTSRRIAKPIAHLSQVTNLIAQSARSRKTGTDFYPVVRAKSIKEIKLLAQSFNEMVIQLKAAFRDLENTNEQLEERVKQRTEALVKAKEAADAANRAKSQFLANMSHELRTPLHAILGFTQVALQDPTLKLQQKENLITVKQSGEHLLTLINDILDMSKIESGSISVDKKPFDLYLLLGNLAKMFELRRRNKNLELRFDLSPQLPRYIQTDPVKLNQVLINLIENGIKFTDRGRVSLTVQPVKAPSLKRINPTTANDRAIAFQVEDTGCGVLPSELESIFVPFTQTKQISHQEGTGLGLAISQQFVRLLGGEITVESILGKGSKFEFQIPITVVNSQQLKTKTQPKPSRRQLHGSLKRQPPQPELSTSKEHISEAIDVSTLATMSSPWIEQLQHAAIAVDADLIKQLSQQIPTTNISLTQGLIKMLKNFEYDEICELTEQELNRRKKLES